jgi:hypothetical protein
MCQTSEVNMCRIAVRGWKSRPSWYVPRPRHTQASDIIALSLNISRHDLRANNFNLIHKKYMQHFYLQVNLLKKLDSNIYLMILIMYHKY